MSSVKLNLVVPYILGFIGNIFVVFYLFLMWLEPNQFSINTIVNAIVLLGMEFFLVHAGIFTSGVKSKKFLLGLFLFYGIFIWALSAQIKGSTLLYVYGMIVVSRIWQPGVREEIEVGSNQVSYSSAPEAAGRVFFYLISAGLVAALYSFIPVLGLTEAFLEASGYHLLMQNSSGTDDPKIFFSFGIIYFLLLSAGDAAQLLFYMFKSRENTSIKQVLEVE